MEADSPSIAAIECSSSARCTWLWLSCDLTVALTRWLQGARLALVLLAVVAVISGAGLAFAALGNGLTPVNVFWALGSLLGLNLILLISWALGLLFAGEHGARRAPCSQRVRATVRPGLLRKEENEAAHLSGPGRRWWGWCW